MALAVGSMTYRINTLMQKPLFRYSYGYVRKEECGVLDAQCRTIVGVQRHPWIILLAHAFQLSTVKRACHVGGWTNSDSSEPQKLDYPPEQPRIALDRWLVPVAGLCPQNTAVLIRRALATSLCLGSAPTTRLCQGPWICQERPVDSS
jgi:hypothetical protein